MEEPEELGRGYMPHSELGLKHGNHGWKSLEEHNGIETPE
jgi:hypothetical protein